MQGKWRIGSLFGIPLFIDSSWLLVLVFVTFVNAEEISAQGLFATENFLWGWATGLALALLLFASVLLHELGHSLVARSQGIAVNSITLFLFGGVASIDQESNTPQQALQVAIAGPAVSITLFLSLFALSEALAPNGVAHFVTLDLARINLIIGLFNLIPGLPLDGGQVLKALVWKFTGDRFQGVRWAAATGKALGWLGISLGFLVLLLTGEFGGIWIALIGWFVLRNANAYEKVTSLQEALMKLTAADAMTRDYQVIDANLSLREFAEAYILSDLNHPKPYYAASEGRYRGLIGIDDLQKIERSEWEEKTLRDIAHPLTNIPSVTEKTPLYQVINALEDQSETRLTVLSPADAVAGVVDRGDILVALAQKYQFAFPKEAIKRIKQEGTYPPGLDLGAIAKMIHQNDESTV
jgi:Zn-dependent protease